MNESMDIDNPDASNRSTVDNKDNPVASNRSTVEKKDNPAASNRSTPEHKENGLHLYPVSPNDAGEGLPYAPEDWPSPGDKWRWKAGKRIAASGYYMDRYLYLPSRLGKIGKPGQRRNFASKLSVEQYVQATFPGTDVNAFFASFSWKIPSKQFVSKEISGFESHFEPGGCKAGNKMCSSLSEAPVPSPLEAMFCDICCSEPRFCRECCCILCCKTINTAIGGYSYITCKATVLDGNICGHIAHIDCALRAYVAGSVGGSIGLDAEYFCRRCDSRTDLISVVMNLLQTCETIESQDEIEKMLNLAICMLRGSRKMTARQLLRHIESAMSKLKMGADFEHVWNKEAYKVVIGESAPHNGNGILELANSDKPRENKTDLPGNLSSHFDHRIESLQLDEDIDQVLQSLRKSQEVEYNIAEERLFAQRNYIMNLYEQLDKERSQLVNHTSLTDSELLLSAVMERIEEVKREVTKLGDMKQVERGFGRTSKLILEEHFGLKSEQ